MKNLFNCLNSEKKKTNSSRWWATMLSLWEGHFILTQIRGFKDDTICRTGVEAINSIEFVIWVSIDRGCSILGWQMDVACRNRKWTWHNMWWYHWNLENVGKKGGEMSDKSLTQDCLLVHQNDLKGNDL